MTRRRTFVRVEELLGCRVRADDGGDVGRIEEIRVERRGERYEVTELLLGTGALFERVAMRWFRRKTSMLVARWDQVDISRPGSPRLTCRRGELKRG